MYTDILIKTIITESKKAYKKHEVPVGAIIYCPKTKKIVAKAHNLTKKNNDVFSHAEMICIKKVSKKLKDWRLSSYDIYTTLEPCKSCLAIIEASRIKNVYFLVEQVNSEKKLNSFKVNLIKLHGYEKEADIIKSFFSNVRESKL